MAVDRILEQKQTLWEDVGNPFRRRPPLHNAVFTALKELYLYFLLSCLHSQSDPKMAIGGEDHHHRHLWPGPLKPFHYCCHLQAPKALPLLSPPSSSRQILSKRMADGSGLGREEKRGKQNH